jgi:hypothetical protein
MRTRTCRSRPTAPGHELGIVDRYLRTLGQPGCPSGSELSAMEHDFVQVAAHVGRCLGISRETWDDMGVSSSILERAGIPDDHWDRYD